MQNCCLLLGQCWNWNWLRIVQPTNIATAVIDVVDHSLQIQGNIRIAGQQWNRDCRQRSFQWRWPEVYLRTILGPAEPYQIVCPVHPCGGLGAISSAQQIDFDKVNFRPQQISPL